MFLTVTSTAPDATDLGFLLAKHPDRVQQFELPFGTAHVFYPEATAERCTVAVLVEVDAIELARGRRFRGDRATLGAYVNDRPYAASSGRPASSYAVAASRRFLASLASTFSTSSALNSWWAPALSSTVIAVSAMRSVADVTLSCARIASVRSACKLAFVTVIPAILASRRESIS